MSAKAKKNICVFQVSQPYQRFWPDPKHFIVLKEKKKGKKKKGEKKKITKKKNKRAMVTKHTARFCPCGPFLFRCSVVPITGRLALKFEIFVTSFRVVSSFYFLKTSQNFCD